MTDLLNGLAGFGSGIAITVWIAWLWLWPLRCPDERMHVGGPRRPIGAGDAARRDLASYADYLADDDVVVSLDIRRLDQRGR